MSRQALFWLCLMGAIPLVLPPLVLGQDKETGPEALQEELEGFLNRGVPESGDVNGLLQLAAVYLDLGYGVYVEPSKKMMAFQEGARLAKKALSIQESSSDAHFLYAANLGSAAEIEGLVSSALTIQELQRHVHRVLELDETYAPAHHMLGRMYEELPWFLGGDQAAAGDHLREAVKLNPLYAPARLDWARWLLRQGQEDEARKELTIVINQPPREKQWIWERKHRPEAIVLLRQISPEAKSIPLSPEDEAVMAISPCLTHFSRYGKLSGNCLNMPYLSLSSLSHTHYCLMGSERISYVLAKKD